MNKLYNSPDCLVLTYRIEGSVLTASNEDYIVDYEDPGFNF